MLKAWHLPVAPFIKVQQDRLFITLWLSGESLPQRITLRAEEDNEELSLPMQRLRQAPQPGVVAWRGEISLASGQPRRRYSFKLLWADHQRWFTPQGFTRFPPARLEQFAIDLPDAGPQWVADQVFYQIFPDRFARSAARDADQDAVYYHHAAGREIVRKAWDDPLTGEAGGSTFYGGDLDGISEKLPYLKQLGVTALYLNPVFAAPSVHKYDTEDYRRVDPQFGGDAALLRLRHNTQRAGMRMILDGVFNHTGDSHPGSTVTSRAAAAPATIRTPRGATGLPSQRRGRRTTGWAMPVCRSSTIGRPAWSTRSMPVKTVSYATG